MNSEKSGDGNMKPSYLEGQWTTGLFDCGEDRSICLKAFFCPCIVFGQIVEIVDRGNTSSRSACATYAALHVVRCTWLYASQYRSKLRALFKLPEAPCADTMVHCCCCVCATSQEHRELINRGIDPSLGWEGNVEKWKKEGVCVPPIFPSHMAR